jgi:hypothetical protein
MDLGQNEMVVVLRAAPTSGIAPDIWGLCLFARARRVPEEDWAYARALREGTHRSRIYGRVSPVFKLWRGGSGLPTIAGATVHIHGKSKMWSVTTDASGFYSVENVEPGQYRVEAEAPGYTSIGPTPKFDVRAIGCGYGPIAMTAAGRIAGRVVRHNGSAAAGATLSYQFAEPIGQGTIQSTTANEKGEFFWDGVPPVICCWSRDQRTAMNLIRPCGCN